MHSCCHRSTPLLCDSHSTPVECSAGGRTWLGRIVSAVPWAVPGVVLALMPKCPACLAAYVALATGLGIPFAAAAWTRWLLIMLCTSLLSYLTIRRLCRFLLRPAVR